MSDAFSLNHIYIYALHQMVVFLPWSPVQHHCVFFTTGKKIKTDGANSVFSFHSQKIQSGFLSENIAVRPYLCVRADDDETTPNQTKTPGLNWERAVPFVTSPRDDSHHTLSGTRIEHTLRAQGLQPRGFLQDMNSALFAGGLTGHSCLSLPSSRMLRAATASDEGSCQR